MSLPRDFSMEGEQIVMRAIEAYESSSGVLFDEPQYEAVIEACHFDAAALAEQIHDAIEQEATASSQSESSDA